MGTVEELFSNARDTLDRQVFIPIVMDKLAQRGYVPESEEDVAELLKYAGLVREGLATGEIIPVPVTALDANGTMSKQASDAIEADPLAFGDEYVVDLDKEASEVQDAVALSLCDALDKEAAGKLKGAYDAITGGAKAVGKGISTAANAVKDTVTNADAIGGKVIGKGVDLVKKNPVHAVAGAGAGGYAAGKLNNKAKPAEKEASAGAAMRLKRGSKALKSMSNVSATARKPAKGVVGKAVDTVKKNPGTAGAAVGATAGAGAVAAKDSKKK